MLEARGVWFRYGQGPWVVEDDDLALAQGEVVGLRGPSGCGKTTLARILAGYLIPHRGQISVDGSPQPGQGVRPVQLIFQHPELAVDPRWRLAEVIGEAGPVDTALLDELSIARGWMDRYPNELSGGELQRVVVARALLSKARYLVADEISAMLDPITAAQIWHVLLDRVRRGQIGVLAISHDDALLQTVANRSWTFRTPPARAPQARTALPRLGRADRSRSADRGRQPAPAQFQALTLRKRNPRLVAAVAALPDDAWTTAPRSRTHRQSARPWSRQTHPGTDHVSVGG